MEKIERRLLRLSRRENRPNFKELCYHAKQDKCHSKAAVETPEKCKRRSKKQAVPFKKTIRLRDTGLEEPRLRMVRAPGGKVGVMEAGKVLGGAAGQEQSKGRTTGPGLGIRGNSGVTSREGSKAVYHELEPPPAVLWGKSKIEGPRAHS